MTDTDSLLQKLHEDQRVRKIAAAGLSGNAAFQEALAALNPPMWKNFGAPPAENALQDSLATKLYNVRPGMNDTAFITLGDGSRYIGARLIEKCRADGVPFVVQFDDPDFNALLLNHTDDKGVQALADDFLKLTAPATRRIVAAAGVSERRGVEADRQKSFLYKRLIQSYADRVQSGDLFYTLTVIPTRQDAEIDGIAYDDYIKLFFEMCDQPWAHIGRAHEKLIGEFNAARTVRLTNADGTDVSMDIEGFTFCNSLIAKNVPGSEIFSAPRRDSVNGKVVAKGKFAHGGRIIQNLTMEFENGHLVRWRADAGQDVFEEAIAVDEGARWVGELGIGTNPHLKRHVANGLLVEKIGGSFHLALGAAYTMKEYAGIPVNIDNGNKSALHWDITTMLYGKGGRIYLDGRLIMDDGKFLDPACDVLNRGWAAIPENERPDYWKKKIGDPAA